MRDDHLTMGRDELGEHGATMSRTDEKSPWRKGACEALGGTKPDVRSCYARAALTQTSFGSL
jgi:hypothetical protein